MLRESSNVYVKADHTVLFYFDSYELSLSLSRPLCVEVLMPDYLLGMGEESMIRISKAHRLLRRSWHE